jgi:hypothetical protein
VSHCFVVALEQAPWNRRVSSSRRLLFGLHQPHVLPEEN